MIYFPKKVPIFVYSLLTGYLNGPSITLLFGDLRLVQFDGEYVDCVEGLHGVVQLLSPALGINMSFHQKLGKKNQNGRIRYEEKEAQKI